MLCIAHELITTQPAFPSNLPIQKRKEAVDKYGVEGGIFGLFFGE